MLPCDVCSQVEINRATGRRKSVLTAEFKAELDHCSGIWEASDDSDEDSVGSESSMSSSFVDIRASRNKSAVASLFSAMSSPVQRAGHSGQSGDPNGPTHHVLKDAKGRRVSVLDEAVLSSADTNHGQWGGFDSDESDAESRPSMSVASTHPHSHSRRVRPPSTRQAEAEREQEQSVAGGDGAAVTGAEGEKAAPKKSMASSMTDFIARRRHSLF